MGRRAVPKSPRKLKVGSYVRYVDRKVLRGGQCEHKARVQAINDDGSLSLLVTFKGFAKIPFASVRPLNGNGPEGWR